MSVGFNAISVKGIKRNLVESRIILVTVNDPVLGNIQISIFASAGDQPETTVGIVSSEPIDNGNELFQEWKRDIESNNLMPTQFSTGSDSQVCAQSVAVYNTNRSLSKRLNCNSPSLVSSRSSSSVSLRDASSRGTQQSGGLMAIVASRSSTGTNPSATSTFHDLTRYDFFNADGVKIPPWDALVPFNLRGLKNQVVGMAIMASTLNQPQQLSSEEMLRQVDEIFSSIRAGDIVNIKDYRGTGMHYVSSNGDLKRDSFSDYDMFMGGSDMIALFKENPNRWNALVNPQTDYALSYLSGLSVTSREANIEVWNADSNSWDFSPERGYLIPLIAGIFPNTKFRLDDVEYDPQQYLR